MELTERRFLSFAIFEKNRGQWHNNWGHDYHIDLSLERFRASARETEYTMEREIAEFLEYSEHHKLHSADLLDYLDLTPEKVVAHLMRLLPNGDGNHESEIFILKTEEDKSIFENGRKTFCDGMGEQVRDLEWDDEML